jgi:predicted CXXCH cytochrome family protein
LQHPSLALLGSVSLCSAAFGGITGSAHDFSASAWSKGQICIVCHAPHNNANAAGELLWNHEVTTTTFDLYNSATFDAVEAGSNQPGGVSKLCLSCHDGTVAIDSFGGDTGGTHITGDRNFGTDMGNDHPVSFTYDTALASADGYLADPATDLPDTVKMFDGKLECASCHDVHNKLEIGTLLNVGNAGSGLCLTCHIK